MRICDTYDPFGSFRWALLDALRPDLITFGLGEGSLTCTERLFTFVQCFE